MERGEQISMNGRQYEIVADMFGIINQGTVSSVSPSYFLRNVSARKKVI